MRLAKNSYDNPEAFAGIRSKPLPCESTLLKHNTVYQAEIDEMQWIAWLAMEHNELRKVG